MRNVKVSMRWLQGRCLILAILLLGSGSVAGSVPESIAELLRQAEAARSADPVKMQELLKQLDLLKEHATQEQQEQLQYLGAYSKGFAGQFEQSIQQARYLFENSENVEMRYRAGMLVANAQAMTRQFADGMRQLELTMQMIDHVRNPEVRHQGFGVAALMYNHAGQYQRSLEYSERILAESPNERTTCFARQTRLESLFKLERLPSNDQEIVSAIEHCLGQSELVVANTIRTMLARRWAGQGQVDQAIDLLRWHIPEIEALNYPYLIGDARALLAELLLSRGDVGAAGDHASRVASHRESLMGSLPLATAYRVLYNIAESRGDTTAALEAYRNYAEADKAYLNEVKARELAYQSVRLETEQMNQQIERLNQQNELLRLQQEVDQRSSMNSRLLVLLLLLVVAFVMLWAYRIKRVQVSLKALAETDTLTGAASRYHFTQTCEAILAQHRRDGWEAALIMFDLDHFKQVNDRHGHAAGDWVLQQVGRVCGSVCRPEDLLARVGGEEFAVLAPQLDLLSAVRLAENLRIAIMAIDTRGTGHDFQVTASFGVATTSVHGHDLNRLLSQADHAMYQAKSQGRNRICIQDGGEDVHQALQLTDEAAQSGVEQRYGIGMDA